MTVTIITSNNRYHNNNNNSDNKEYNKYPNTNNSDYNNNNEYHGWTRQAIGQMSDTNNSHVDHTCNAMRVEKRKYKSSPSPSDNDGNENNLNDINDKQNEELDNQLDNYTSLRNATPVIEHVELDNDSESDVTVIPVKIDDKSNDKK